MSGEPKLRPLDFVRVRLRRGGEAEYIQRLLTDEKEALLDDLGRLRDEGVAEDDPRIEEIRESLRHLISVLRDVDSGRVELAGSGRDF